MLAKSILVIFLATLALSLAHKDENDAFSTVLGIANKVLKLNPIDPDKLPVELNTLYKKYEVPGKVNQAKSYLKTQFERGIELANKYSKIGDSKEELKKSIKVLKKEDPVLVEKLNEFLEKINDMGRMSKDIVTYLSDADKIQKYYGKTKVSLYPLEQNVFEILKKTKFGVIEMIKKGKGKVDEHFSNISPK